MQENIDTKENNDVKTTNSNTQNNNETRDEDSKYKEGQTLSFVRVRFPGHAKSYPFLIGKRKLMYGQKVMAMSDRGVAVGYINSFPYEAKFKNEMLPIKSISKVATAEDIKNEKDTYKKQKETETLCQNLIEKHNLQMNLTHVEFTGYGKKVVFYFVAPARVDFRNLVRDLVSELKLRIELRQISVRDRAASMGALGPCGRELCCSSFLSKYGNVSVKMAKNQNLTLNYSKLNGVCGQLKCCLQYEDEVYSNKRKRIPDEGKFVKLNDGNAGKVLRIHLLSEQFDVLTNRGQIKRYVSSMFDKTVSEADAKMPRRFDNISDETGNVIGLTEQESLKAKNFQNDIDKLTKKTKEFAFNTFYELTGVEKPEFTYEEPEVKDEKNFANQIVMKKAPEVSETPIVEAKSSTTKETPTTNSDTEVKKKKPYNKNRNNRNNNNRNKKKPNPNAKSKTDKPSS
jgi:cell fate regulator YaaT (PSP1 superfamily)